MNVKAAVMLALVLLAFATTMTATLNLRVPDLYRVSNNFTAYDDDPSQPCGDPVDEDGTIPH